MTPDDQLYRFRQRTLALAEELGNVRAACRVMGIHASTFYRWRRDAERYGLEMLRPRERRRPRMPNATSPFVEQVSCLRPRPAPRLTPQRIAADCRQRGIQPPLSVWRCAAHGPHPPKRLASAARRTPEDRSASPSGAHWAKQPGALVQFDCFHVGRLSGTKGTVWQYTAIDVASAYSWAELHTTPRNPSAKWTSRLARRVAADLAARGWELETVMTDNGSEFRSREFGATVAELGAEQRFIQAGRPQTNGCVERVQGTILEECWKPAFARHLIPKQTGLRRDLERYLRYYNTDRAHTGRWTRGRTPERVIGKAKVWS